MSRADPSLLLGPCYSLVIDMNSMHVMTGDGLSPELVTARIETGPYASLEDALEATWLDDPSGHAGFVHGALSDLERLRLQSPAVRTRSNSRGRGERRPTRPPSLPLPVFLSWYLPTHVSSFGPNTRSMQPNASSLFMERSHRPIASDGPGSGAGATRGVPRARPHAARQYEGAAATALLAVWTRDLAAHLDARDVYSGCVVGERRAGVAGVRATRGGGGGRDRDDQL